MISYKKRFVNRFYKKIGKTLKIPDFVFLMEFLDERFVLCVQFIEERFNFL